MPYWVKHLNGKRIFANKTWEAPWEKVTVFDVMNVFASINNATFLSDESFHMSRKYSGVSVLMFHPVYERK